jgi:thiamine biosynthesis lipoprotein ApbE
VGVRPGRRTSRCRSVGASWWTRLDPRIGYRSLDVRLAPPGLRKRHDVYVDLSAIAQGYTADAVSALLDRRGCPSHMVEIGGEVRVGARKPDGQRWRIAIDPPDHEAKSAPVLLLAKRWCFDVR